jgi:hypothetical protein
MVNAVPAPGAVVADSSVVTADAMLAISPLTPRKGGGHIYDKVLPGGAPPLVYDILQPVRPPERDERDYEQVGAKFGTNSTTEDRS